MITEGSGLVLPIQVCSPFKMISIITVFQLVKMEKYLQRKREVLLVCTTGRCNMVKGISGFNITSFRKQHIV